MDRTDAAMRINRVPRLLTAALIDLSALQLVKDFGLTATELKQVHDLELVLELWRDDADIFARQFCGEFQRGLKGDGI